MTSVVKITDHVVVRYMERQHAFPIEAIRKEIGDKVRAAAMAGASFLVVGDVRFAFVMGSDGTIAVTTAMPRTPLRGHTILNHSLKNNHHAGCLGKDTSHTKREVGAMRRRGKGKKRK